MALSFTVTHRLSNTWKHLLRTSNWTDTSAYRQKQDAFTKLKLDLSGLI